jgi:hypothetical protein
MIRAVPFVTLSVGLARHSLLTDFGCSKGAKIMSRISSVLVRRYGPLLLALVALTPAQLFSQNQPLGDVAREQKDSRKQTENSGKPPKILTNDDLSPRSATGTSGTTPSPAASAEGQDSPPKESQSKESKSAASESQPIDTKNFAEGDAGNSGGPSAVDSVLDRPKHPEADAFVVPAGTQLKVDIGGQKIVVPVRVGFATPIPALSQVTVQVTRSYVAIPYSFGGAPYNAGVPNVDYIEYARLTAIIVGGTTYPVQTDSLPLLRGATNSEVTFTLGDALRILR